MTQKVKIYYNPEGLGHDTGPGHPERIARLQVLLDLLKARQHPLVRVQDSPPLAWIARAHDRAYIEKIQDMIPEEGYVRADSDTVLSPGSWDAAVTAVAAVCQAVDDVLDGKIQRAFCAVRPPGHHAFPGHSEGFCIFNNIFIGALHARQKIERVAILDFDVHHGNGTDSMARRHDGIFFASSHQWPLYPGTGLPENNIPDRVINVTMTAGEGSSVFRNLWREQIIPALDQFAPELVMISAGFDAHRDDPLAQINLTEDDYAWITEELAKIADKHSRGRIISVLEGGYDLDALQASVAAHLDALAG